MEIQLEKKLDALSPKSREALYQHIITIKDKLDIVIPKQLTSEFDQYQFVKNKSQLVVISLVGMFIYSCFFLPTNYFVPDMVVYDSAQRVVMIILFSLVMYFLFNSKHQRATYIDIFICTFTIISSLLWLAGIHLSTVFDTPSFLIANASFVFISSILIKTRLVYPLISAIIISFATVLIMLGKYHDMTRAFYEITFIFLPIVIFGLVFSWQNIENGKRKFLQETLDYLEKSDLSSDNEQLQNQAETDSLTQIPNRRAFEAKHNNLLYRIENTNEKISVFFADIDYFKQFNDNYGHLAGDHTLQKVANALKELVKKFDAQVYRFGGEEFVLVFRYHKLDDLKLLAETVCTTIRSLTLAHDFRFDEKHIVTVSIGACIYNHQKHNNLIDMLRHADKKLYEAKDNGRDCYRIAY